MTTGADLLRGVLAEPDEDAPRLVYADHLEETGDEADQARARLIRLQCRIAALEELSPERLDLEAEEEVLLADHGKEWRTGVPRWARPLTGEILRRGFVERVRMTPALLLARGSQLFRQHPIRSLVLHHFDPPSDWPASPHLARVRELRNLCLHHSQVGRAAQ